MLPPRVSSVAQLLIVALLHWTAALPPHWVHHLPIGASGAHAHRHANAESHHQSHQQQVEQDTECVLLHQGHSAGCSLLPHALTLRLPDARAWLTQPPQAVPFLTSFFAIPPSRGPPA